MALPDISKLRRFIALVIRFDPHTGARAGGIDVRRDTGLFCLPLWQDLERGVEMRLVLDDRDVEPYRETEGIEVVAGKAAINAKVKELFKPRYSIVSGALLSASIAAKGIRIDDVDASLPVREQVRILYERGALGIRKDEPYLLPEE